MMSGPKVFYLHVDAYDAVTPSNIGMIIPHGMHLTL